MESLCTKNPTINYWPCQFCCTGENQTIDTLHRRRRRRQEECKEIRLNEQIKEEEKTKSIPIFTLFFNGNYVQTQWQWAGTLNANDCRFFSFSHFSSMFTSLCSLSSRDSVQIWARVLMISMRWHRCVRVTRNNFNATKCGKKTSMIFTAAMTTRYQTRLAYFISHYYTFEWQSKA